MIYLCQYAGYHLALKILVVFKDDRDAQSFGFWRDRLEVTHGPVNLFGQWCFVLGVNTQTLGPQLACNRQHFLQVIDAGVAGVNFTGHVVRLQAGPHAGEMLGRRSTQVPIPRPIRRDVDAGEPSFLSQ